MKTIIVSRHEGAIAWLLSKPEIAAQNPPVLRGDVSAEDVSGNIVYGNLPMHLAALAAEINIVEFIAAPPRGVDYTMEQMKENAVIRKYHVQEVK
jgi:putative CRISPR-associated protein (TIGR02620 family)